MYRNRGFLRQNINKQEICSLECVSAQRMLFPTPLFKKCSIGPIIVSVTILKYLTCIFNDLELGR